MFFVPWGLAKFIMLVVGKKITIDIDFEGKLGSTYLI